MIIKRKTAALLPNLFDYAFKKGVVDAYEMGNDYECREFIDKCRANSDFALLDMPDYVMTWREWRYHLTTWCRYAKIYKLSEELLDKITTINYAWVVFPVCMDFYLMGAEEWLENPNPIKIAEFKRTKKVHWKVVAKHLQTMKRDDLLAYAQGFAYERIRHEANMEGKQLPNKLAYMTFCQAIWALTRPLPKREKPDLRFKKVKVVEKIV